MKPSNAEVGMTTSDLAASGSTARVTDSGGAMEGQQLAQALHVSASAS
jgi:hypothetical protein